jgi:peptide/nickel transport system substrate-binding protein
MYDPLLTFDPKGNIIPAVAESWKLSPDGKTWTFQLRHGVTFQKGYGEMTAADVKFSLERILDPAVKSPYASLMRSLDRVEVLDPYTVRLVLKQPDPAILDKLANTYTSIVSEKAVRAEGARFAHEPVGTGPYQFDHWATQQETVYAAFDGYWGGRPRLDRVVYVPIPDATTMYNAFEAGNSDLIQVTDPDKLRRYKADAKFTVSEVPGLITRFAGMNGKDKPFDDKRVRMAVLHAVNKDEIMRGVFRGISTPAQCLLAPGVEAALQRCTQYAYDPALSKKLLAEAGLPNGFRATMYVPNIDRFTNPSVVIQENLRAVGIDLQLQVMEAQSYLAKLESADGMPMFILSRGQDATPDRVLFNWFSTKGIPQDNWANISDPQVDRWLDEAITTMDPGKRRDLFYAVQRRIVDEAYYLVLDHENMIFAMRAWVHGFVSDPQRSIRLDRVSVSR